MNSARDTPSGLPRQLLYLFIECLRDGKTIVLIAGSQVCAHRCLFGGRNRWTVFFAGLRPDRRSRQHAHCAQYCQEVECLLNDLGTRSLPGDLDAFFLLFTYSRLSDFSAVRTSDWDKPNCRAMRAGVMPALKAARTAFSCPRVNDPAASTFRLSEGS